MKISVYIGHHKTGSTSIQAHFAANRLAYLRQGVLYPMVEAQGLAVAQAEALAGRSLDDVWRGLNMREPHNALAFRLLNEAAGAEVPHWHPMLPSAQQMFRAIAMQAEVLSPQHMVLCSEVMCRFALEEPEKIMPRLVANFGDNPVTLVLSLRRPDTHLASWHLQRLKFGHTPVPLREGGYRDYLGGAHFLYDRIVEGFRRWMPAARLVLRNYDDVVTAGGSVADFLSQAGIPAIASEARRMNGSVPYAFAEILRQVRARDAGLASLLIEHVLEAEGRLQVPGNAEVEMFGADHRAKLADAFAPIHARLSHQTGSVFFPDVEEMRISRPMPELEAARIALDALKRDLAETGPRDGLAAAVDQVEIA